MVKQMRITDPQIVADIICHKEVYPFVSDDGSPDPDNFANRFVPATVSNDQVYCLMPNKTALFVYMPINAATWEVHTCVLKKGRGLAAMKAARASIRYMFTKTPCKKIMSHVPEYQRHVLLFALKNGLKKEGVNRKSYLKDGKLYDQTLVGITKEEWIKCQQQQQ